MLNPSSFFYDDDVHLRCTLPRFSFVCALTIGFALQLKAIHLFSLKSPRLLFLEVIFSCGWITSLNTALGEMGSRGTIIRLLNFATQVSSLAGPYWPKFIKEHQTSACLELRRPNYSINLKKEQSLRKVWWWSTWNRSRRTIRMGQSLHAMTSIASKIS